MPSVLTPICLEKASFYTNGHYLMVVIPPPLATDYGYDTNTHLCRSFSMRDGTFIGNFSLEGHAIGSASCYDPIQNVIWNYSSSGAEVVKYSNEGIAPKHRFPLPNKSMRMTPLNNTTNNNNNNETTTANNGNNNNNNINNNNTSSNIIAKSSPPKGGNTTPRTASPAPARIPSPALDSKPTQSSATSTSSKGNSPSSSSRASLNVPEGNQYISERTK